MPFSNKTKYAASGALFGCCFPIVAMSIDFLRLGLPLSMATIAEIQVNNPIHFIINTAPIFLGLFALIGGVRQDKIEVINQQLSKEVSIKELKLDESEADLKEAKSIKAQMENELNIAKEIQQSMLPIRFPAFPHRKDIDIYAKLIPAKEVGGDFYDFFFLDEQHLCFVVGDVSGKGIPAALTMVQYKTMLKATAHSHRSTADILTLVNNEMAKDNSACMFATIFIAILNTQTKRLLYSNAGHNPTYICKQNQPLKKLSQLHGVVLGAMENIIYGESLVQLEKNDIIFAYTDGITEAHNANGDLFSDERLSALLEENIHLGADELVKKVIQATQDFEQGLAAFDDLTALCIRV